nr:ATP-binding cassette domain-containing protein [bacterium]
MLELKHIKKSYRVGDVVTRALDDISVCFREKEFVAILGASGSGKTTCLNIIGGLDRYDEGDLCIKGKSTKDFKDRDWDAYRNNSIGFVFQNYNLIPHLSIVANVELGMTLSGVSPDEKHRRALEVLEQVGLKDHLHKKPNQLSGGQMQRVAIARALANNPEILLCDEPTGALDTATSVQILDLIQKVAQKRLVIMVTHNPELAEKYADRIIRFSDGKIIADSNPYQPDKKQDSFTLTKTSMSFFTALRLSFNNLRTKLGRTFLTSFASSIGIIGIALILSLSTGFQAQVDKFQSDAMAEFPIIISQAAMQMDEETMMEHQQQMADSMLGKNEYPDTDEVTLYDPSENMLIHTNVFTQEYIDYLEKIDPAICSSIGYTRLVNMNLLRKVDGKAVPVAVATGMSGGGGMMSSMSGIGLSSYPIQLDGKETAYLEKNYDLLAGSYPEDETGLVLVVDHKNRVDKAVFEKLGYDIEGVDAIKFSDLVGLELKLIPNDAYYTRTEMGNFIPRDDYEAMYDAEDAITLKLCGVIRQKQNVRLAALGSGIAYSDVLVQRVLDSSLESQIVQAQKEMDVNVMSMRPFENEGGKANMIEFLGGNATPYMAFVYPRSFDDKNQIIAYLDAYNEGKEEADTIQYTDLAETISEMSGSIMTGITIVLVAFAAISLVVSLIMICIITYTSVLERTKEIGILKALGARKKDISRVFDAETCILGVFSGVLGILIAWLLTFPVNAILYHLTELTHIARLQPLHAIMLIAISTVLTMLGGHIPARIAAKKDAVEALRTE